MGFNGVEASGKRLHHYGKWENSLFQWPFSIATYSYVKLPEGTPIAAWVVFHRKSPEKWMKTRDTPHSTSPPNVLPNRTPETHGG